MPRLSRQRFERLFPRPEPTPPGMVWRTVSGHTFLVDARVAEIDSRRKMGNYDRYPEEVRKNLMEGKSKFS
jgi:hypothetical protein